MLNIFIINPQWDTFFLETLSNAPAQKWPLNKMVVMSRLRKIIQPELVQ